MKITDDWLTAPDTQRVLSMLTSAGQQAFCVGGCVRNALLGVAASDIDIATDALPARVMDLARSAGMDAIPTGIDHGTITVVLNGTPFEITTFRRDVETDGRHAVVTFSDSPAEDAARRDFTMNALYARADGSVIDPLGGLPDLQAGVVRFIGDPRARIAEDYLRILRFFRFTAWYGAPDAGLEAEGLAACAEGAEGLERVSAERVGQEVRKLLAAPDPTPAVAAMAHAGVLARVLPGADVSALGPLVAQDRPSDWVTRLAAVGGDVSDLRLSKAEARAVEQVAVAARDSAGAFGLGDLLGARGEDAIAVRCALMGQPLDADAIAEARRGAEASFPLTASDLMPDLSGPELGAALSLARSAWRASRGRMSKGDLIRLAGGRNKFS